jgi:hypothetical protein
MATYYSSRNFIQKASQHQAHLRTLEELYGLCQEHHQHYRSLLLEYQSKVLNLTEKVSASKIKLDEAKLKLEQEERKLKLEETRQKLEQAEQELGAMDVIKSSDYAIIIDDNSSNNSNQHDGNNKGQEEKAMQEPPEIALVHTDDSNDASAAPAKQPSQGQQHSAKKNQNSATVKVTPTRQSSLPKYSPRRQSLLPKYSPKRQSPPSGAASTPTKETLLNKANNPNQGRNKASPNSYSPQMPNLPTNYKQQNSRQGIVALSPRTASPGSLSSWSPTVATLPEQKTTAGWLKMLSKANKFYRIRHFVNKVKRTEMDPYGRKPALWSLQNGMIMNGVHEVVYQKFQPSSKITVVCRFFNSTPCPVGYSSTQWAMDWEFCKMSAGDIVCLILPNMSNHQEVCFGVVQDHKITLEETRNLANDWGSDVLPSKIEFVSHLLLRRVRWMRKAKLRELPGQRTDTRNNAYVDWLMETSPRHLMNVTGRGARDHLQSEEFLHVSTSELEDEGEEEDGEEEFLR